MLFRAWAVLRAHELRTVAIDCAVDLSDSVRCKCKLVIYISLAELFEHLRRCLRGTCEDTTNNYINEPNKHKRASVNSWSPPAAFTLSTRFKSATDSTKACQNSNQGQNEQKSKSCIFESLHLLLRTASISFENIIFLIVEAHRNRKNHDTADYHNN